LNQNDFVDVPIIVQQNEFVQNAPDGPILQGLREEGTEKRNAIIYKMRTLIYNKVMYEKISYLLIIPYFQSFQFNTNIKFNNTERCNITLYIT